jgi:opacity protein-like surface antigen
MKNLKSHCLPAGLAAVCFLSQSVLGQTGQPTTLAGGGNSVDSTASQSEEWRFAFSSDYSAVDAGGVNYNGAKGNSGAQSADANLSAVAPLKDGWFVPMGISSRNFFLGQVPGTPIPSTIDTLGLNAGLGYHINDQWTIAGEAGPRFYRLDSVDSSGIGVGGMVRATYKWTPKLTLAMGLAVNPDRDVPVLPLAGVRWEICSNLTLGVMYPRSGLDYRIGSKLNVFAGFSGSFTVYRAENDLGNRIGMSQFNNGLGTYRDFHVGAGVEYRIVRGLSASVEGGYSFDRELDYQRIDQTVHFGNAPYVQAGLRVRF